jgi:hypothetical protein
MTTLWPTTSRSAWRDALGSYPRIVAGQGVARLAEFDTWYRDELPAAIAARRTPHVTLAELARLTEWKMARGVWRAPNLILVRGNDPDAVKRLSAEALAAAPRRSPARGSYFGAAAGAPTTRAVSM